MPRLKVSWPLAQRDEDNRMATSPQPPDSDNNVIQLRLPPSTDHLCHLTQFSSIFTMNAKGTNATKVYTNNIFL